MPGWRSGLRQRRGSQQWGWGIPSKVQGGKATKRAADNAKDEPARTNST